jgi:hypothetical protein
MGHSYRDLVAGYIAKNYAECGLRVYTEISLGKTILGKSRRVDVFAVRDSDRAALAIECKFQATSGTTDEKIHYALADLEAMWVPGCLCYAGQGWSQGVLRALEASRHAVYCQPDESLARTGDTLQLDHVLASVFGLWTQVLPEPRRFVPGALQPRPHRKPARRASTGVEAAKAAATASGDDEA